MKKLVFKLMSCLLTAALLAVALPLSAFAGSERSLVLPEHTHLFEEYVWEEREFHSTKVHLVTKHSTQQCSVCGFLGEDEVIRTYYEAHDDVIVSDATPQHKYSSNEYHYHIPRICETFRCCGNEDHITPDDDNKFLELHVIDPFVDQEVEMEGICIHCNEMIYW